ncbi:SURF1 family cytochrome oxidase biogenesis protein [Pseudonocardia asaccharolytica]|uniref:SURF1-like protein n=1 Tax=Pseudonocardia asaccharolytica DSM 44247 = NBRC 16224 TaxID=1123024 RepID=A0A511D2J5_9PSEU|nr:SURF1 family cytochrome oxidase biogenesis protein [Pseudonocardia asaccharolytica]GEL17128.1 SURF1-like protein [Pseudonocardia asaccharolytica DSM 44247 = NBRC 16224]
MRFLLRPSWLALIVAVVGFVIACYTFLAPWQFNREAQRDAQQQAIDTSYAIPPAPLQDLVPADGAVTRDVEWRQVSISGTYLPADESLVRLQVVNGKPAFEVLTPMRTEDGRLITINRGSVTSTGQGVPAYAAPPPGTVTVTGRLRVNETDPQDRPILTIDGRRQLYAADSRPLAAATGLDLMPGYIQLSADQPGVLAPLAVTTPTGGAPFSNLSYALQWLTFGVIALVALGYFIRLEVLQRRGGARSKDALRDALAGRDQESIGSPDPAGGGADDGPRETPLADRYGRR